MVAVGMLDASQHFADDNAAETSAYRLYFLHRAGLKTYRGEGGGEFVGGQTEIEIFFSQLYDMFMISIPVIMISVNDWDMQSYNKIPKSQEKSRKHTANRPLPARVNPFPGWGMTRA